jgi:protoporphyrinogen oxidase
MTKPSKPKVVVLGAGVTGLAAGLASGAPVYEAQDEPGGICSSYHLTPGGLRTLPSDPEAYRFEVGGGHWIYGGDAAVLRFIGQLAPVKSYQRRSSVFFSRQNLYVPYPLQNHLGHLDKGIAAKALSEMCTSPGRANPSTMADWLEANFGAALCEFFFAPFHELYTAGLWRKIAPQDAYKSPVDLPTVIQGAFEKTPLAGYNATFIYPSDGLDALVRAMSATTNLFRHKPVVAIDTERHEVAFADGSCLKYDSLISTLPLNAMMKLTGLGVDEEPAPYTSVLVLNIGARRGAECPTDHWLYLPDSGAGFHRVGFYSNVDASFLPASSRGPNDRVGIYVERAYRGGEKPTDEAIQTYSAAVVGELQEWGFICEPDVVDPTWIETAYTWTLPGCRWHRSALKRLEDHDIVMVGRYGRWACQGVADSVRDGLLVGSALRLSGHSSDE